MRLLAIATILIVFGTGGAFAQYDMNHGMMEMWNVRAGLFFPSGDTVDNSEFMIGIEHEHPANKIIRGLSGTLSLTVDWTKITTSVPGGNDDVTLIPVLINWKQHRMMEIGRSWDYGVGIGLYWADDPITDMRLDDGTSFAWQLMLGYHFNPAWFVEARYLANENPGDDGLFGLAVGYTF